MFLITLFAITFISPNDTTIDQTHNIDEVVVVSTGNGGTKRSIKGQVASIDEHLSQLGNVNLIRRGSYAWEPVVNNMQTERLSTTIDGMKIFYACRDKMDPVTSYVESGNLQSISLNSGLEGNPQSTGAIGGSLDLKLRKVGFGAISPKGDSGLTNWNLNGNVGHEFNGHLQVYGADAAYSSDKFYTNFGAFFRHADNYKAGGNEVVSFSQFQKVNAFTNLGYKLADAHIIEGTFIYDMATNVGYPALNMDVKKAEGIITSVSHKWEPLYQPLSLESKLYYNHITHIMDDTHRPDVEIHMDMPGKSWTSGLYSLLKGSFANHDASINYDLYYNRVFADMTMYPGGAAPMYMVTWPDVGTLNIGLALADYISFPHSQSLKLTAKVALQTQKLNSEEGYNALKVFFPRMKNLYNQTVGRVSANYSWQPDAWQINIGAGWGSRAPTVTEAYGYYLNNTFDQYDYIGNPHLKNESAVEVNASAAWQPFASQTSSLSALRLKIDANAFFFKNYIIGEFERRLSPMTVDAEGVKVYNNLSKAQIMNASLSADWLIFKWLGWNAKITYALGKDAHGDNLPLISPFAYQSKLSFSFEQVKAEVSVQGNARQTNYGAKYGETETLQYAIFNINAEYNIPLSHTLLTIRAGVENLFDKAYSTYSDWNKIPQKGRNIYMNLSISL